MWKKLAQLWKLRYLISKKSQLPTKSIKNESNEMSRCFVKFVPGLLLTNGQSVPHQLLDLDFQHVYPSIFFFHLKYIKTKVF